MGRRLDSITDLGQAAIAMGYNLEDSYLFVLRHSGRPKPSKRYIIKVLTEMRGEEE